MNDSWRNGSLPTQGDEPRACAKSWASAAQVGLTLDTLPNVVLVRDLAQLLHCSEKAIRGRVAAGKLPKPFRLGKALAWTREVVGAWLSDRSRSATEADRVHITIATYNHQNKPGLQAIWKMRHPQDPTRELKTTAIAPKGLGRDQAHAWAQGQIGTILPKLLAKAGISKDEPATRNEPNKAKTPTPASTTFKMFVEERFNPEYVAQWKPSTRDIYTRTLRDHLYPFFADLPLEAIDDDVVSRYRGKIMHFQPGTRNLLLSKLRKVLAFALKLRRIGSLPNIERFKDPRPVLVTFTPDEIERLIRAAEDVGPVAHIIVLLALDLGLRVGEICALKWEDVSFRSDTILVQRTVYEGKEQTPKGVIAQLPMSRVLRAALTQHRKKEPVGEFVLYRRVKGEWRPFNQRAVDRLIRESEGIADLKQTGAHFLRHTSITHVANLGSTSSEIQAHARHTRLSTTETYLHQCGLARSRSVMDRVDAAREAQSKKSKRGSKRTKKVAA